MFFLQYFHKGMKKGMKKNDASEKHISSVDITVRHEPSAKRFAARLNDKIGYLSYEIAGPKSLDYAHVFVPPEHRRHGIAAKITKTALDYAQSNGFSVIPSCPYVALYIRNNPEYKTIVFGSA
jgi:predicted GNAT family acetyltransferase